MSQSHTSRKWVRLTAVGLFLALLLLDEGTLASQWRQVRYVDDGDTVVLSDGTRVRYIGINAPEIAHEDRPAERFGPEARDFNRKLVYQKSVRLELDRERQDQYGRLLAYVFLKDGTFVNAELVRTGHAYYVFRTPNTKFDRRFLRLQREAMAKRVGLWRGFPDQQGYYAANSRSKRFHHPDCPFGKMISPKNRVTFRTKYDAFWAGYAPCKRCNP
jgi:endonuclease YncB( thermonuclease family)